MKKALLMLSLVCSMAHAQDKVKSAEKTSGNAKSTGYVIEGDIEGLADSTQVDLLNGNSGVAEATGIVMGGKFRLTGQVTVPDFKAILFNKKPPYLPVFLDNSDVKLTGSANDLEKAKYTGSPTNDQYQAYLALVTPYDNLVAAKEPVDPKLLESTISSLEKFVNKNPGSFVAPLAVYKIHQLNNDGEQMKQLFDKLKPEVKTGPIGNYLAQQIGEAMKNPMGKEMPDFSQADPDGKMVSLKSFRGKYVLVDFWASWCGPCRGENPNVVAAYNRFKNKNFTVLGVSLDRDKQKWVDAVAADGLTWPQVSDLKGWQNEVAQKFGITSIPQNFLLDPSGKVIGKNLRGEALESKLAEVLK